MRTLFIVMLAFLLPLSAFEMSADDENAKIKIPLEVVGGTKLNRTLQEEKICCHYYDMMTSIMTVFSTDLGSVTLTVTNTSTGEVWYDMFDSGSELQTVLPISASDGIYEIVYITETGDIYEGSFTI